MSHTKEVSNKDQCQDDYQLTQNISRTIYKATQRGALVKFLDEFETQSKTYAYHHNLVLTEHRTQIYHKINVLPLIMKRDIYFSENGTIKDNILSDSRLLSNYVYC